MSQAVCGSCSQSFTPVHVLSYPGFEKDKPAGFPQQIVFCKNCGTGNAYPPVSEAFLNDHYKSEKSPWGDLNLLSGPIDFPIHYSLALSRWEVISKYLKGKDLTVLDIGAGNGALGFALCNDTRISKYIAQDLDTQILGRLKEIWPKGSKVELQVASELDFKEGSIDVISFSHVIEHVTRPSDFIKSCLRFLKPGGLVFGEVPFEDFKFKPNTFPHVMFFNPGNFKSMFERLGVKTAECFSCGKLRYSKTKKIDETWERALLKIRKFLPSSILYRQLQLLYGSNQKREIGPWVRFVGNVGGK